MTSDLLTPEAPGALPEDARRAIYEVMALRRDVRHFQPEREVDEAVLDRVLQAAHLAPSVGFSQPWHFIVIRDRAIRERIRQSFLVCREAEAARFPPGRREAYLGHKLEGILEAPLNLCVAVDLRDQGEAILGTTVQPEAVRASACCAVENLWLAARAEGIGVGWVSIVEPAVLRSELHLPPGIEPIAYLCVGHPIAFRRRPMLEESGWRARRPLSESIHRERFQERAQATAPRPSLPTSAPANILPPFDEEAYQAALAHQRTLVKPPGSLGRLEEIAAWYAGARGCFPSPVPENAAIAVFAADHGVTVEGVSAYGSEVTAAMVATIMAGGAAINALAARRGIALTLVDVGVAGDLSSVPRAPIVPLVRRPVRAGSGNLRRAPALTRQEAQQAFAVGYETAEGLAAGGAALLGVGEIGIGNTTAAAALVCAFTGRSPDEVVGRGTGLDEAGLRRKSAVVAEALAFHRPAPDDPIGVLAAIGGAEIAAMTGFVSAAARSRVPIVLDGFVTSAAALVACALEPAVRSYLLASHRSAERGSVHALAALSLTPVLDLELRLGEGTGAALAIELVRTAVAAQTTMASFATAGITRRRPNPSGT